MHILGIDTATRVCGVALMNDQELIAEYIQNIKKTHSQRLLPLIDSLLRDTGVAKNTIEAVAVAAGPGSFTGLRIGVSTARALAQGLNIPAIGVSTLESLAQNLVTGENELICPILDARRDQVYTAIYRQHPAASSAVSAAPETGPKPSASSSESEPKPASESGPKPKPEPKPKLKLKPEPVSDPKTVPVQVPEQQPEQQPGPAPVPESEAQTGSEATAAQGFSRTDPEILLEPSALSIDELIEKLVNYKNIHRIFFPGDGHHKYAPLLRERLGAKYGELPASLTLNRASSVAICALRKIKNNPAGNYSAYSLQPVYIRKPEAERKLHERAAPTGGGATECKTKKSK